jgi:hypothetical protein
VFLEKLEDKLIEKSIEAFIMGLEIYNKPTIKYLRCTPKIEFWSSTLGVHLKLFQILKKQIKKDDPRSKGILRHLPYSHMGTQLYPSQVIL